MTRRPFSRLLVLMVGAFLPAMQLPLVQAQTAVSGPYWPGPAVSGSWFDTSRNGEGIVLQYLPNGKALATWFTYPATSEGSGGNEQAWLITDLGTVEGSKLRFDNVLQPKGATFCDAFDPARVDAVPWGTMELEFRDCNSMTMRFQGPAAYGSGERTMTRLTALDQLNCAGERALTERGARALSGLRTKSGAWYVPSRSGEGWMLEELADGRTLVYWFTYDPQGRQAWTIGTGARNGNRLDITDNLITRGTRFGSGFNAANVQPLVWGTLSFSFTDCNNATVSYASTLPGYGSATRQATRLASLASAACIDGTPEVRGSGTWTELAAMPAPAQSEHATTALDGRIYALGGFGDTRGFKRYDPASNAWSVLPAMPAGRDHLAAFAVDGGVYFSGGSSDGTGDQQTTLFRFDVAANRWEPRPELTTSNVGSHAAVLNGRAYIGSASGTLLEYDPVQRISRTISRSLPARPRDHSQVVAYLGEIWMISGRSPETLAVSIYNPVTESWRSGPSINRGRGGFAAAVVDDQIIIAGGEVLTAPVRVEPSVEIYTAGRDTWSMGPNLPVPVHGVSAAAINGRFYLVSGSVIAGSESGATGRVFSLLPMP